jgi:lipopolysaccharide assembly outer membrane protein LptD (OstA)
MPVEDFYKVAVRNVIFPIFLLCIFALNASGIELSANDPIEYNPLSKHLIATGNARSITEKSGIQADRMEYSSENEIASAQGNTIFTNKRLFALSDSLSYDISSDVITALNNSIYTAPITIDALKLHIERRYQKIKNGALYFGQPDDFAINISAKVLKHCSLKKCAQNPWSSE